MQERINSFLDFVSHFFHYAMYIREVLVGLLLLLVLGGVMISYLENIPLDEALYFTFITGLSIGYGDITPKTPWARLASVGIGAIGMILTGMTVAVATRALADTVRERKKQER